MTCPYCETANHSVAKCPERHEERDGLPSEQDPDHWILEDGLWHASMAFEDGIHTCVCGTSLRTPVERVTEDLRYIAAEYDAPVCRECVATIEGQRAETVPANATFERASELRADGGALTEGELVDRAVREAADLVAAGDSNNVAVGYVVDEHGLEHRRDDVRERLGQLLEQEVVTDGGCDLEGRQAFLAGDAHWCDICSNPFDSLAELIHHECEDHQTAIADGGRPEHRATCEDCAWSYSDEDLVDVSDEMDRHARKEMHDVDLERAVATDGGVDQSSSGTERLGIVRDVLNSEDQSVEQIYHNCRNSERNPQGPNCPIPEYEAREKTNYDESTYYISNDGLCVSNILIGRHTALFQSSCQKCSCNSRRRIFDRGRSLHTAADQSGGDR